MTAPTAPTALTLTGGLYSITQHITRQGRRWATADIVFDQPDGGQVRHEVQIYPSAYEQIGGHITAGAEATVTATGPGYAQTMTIAGHQWKAADNARDVFVEGLRLPYGPDPVPVARILQAIKRDAGHLFDPHHLPGSRKPKLALLLFFAQGHHLAHCHKPLFDGPIYATADGVSLALPDPAGECPSNTQWGTVGSVLARYERMHLADLRSLVRVSDAWQAARDGSDTGEIDHGLLDGWFSRAEECNDPDDGRLTRWEANRVGRDLRAERGDRAKTVETDTNPPEASA